MTRTTGELVADALGLILQRDFRSGLYRDLTAELHEAVDPVTYPVLSGVDRYGPSSAAALGQHIGLDRSIVSRRAARLVAAGLLRTDPDPSDARAGLLTLTDAGETLVRRMRERLATAIERHLSAWNEADKMALADLLHRFATSGPLSA